MENKFMTALHNTTNYTYTENGAITHRSTLSGLMDLFALGGAYRSRSDEDVLFLFKKAFDENPLYAMKCLFYLADCRGGQGERRFFRVCARWLATAHTEAIKKNLELIPYYTRWDNMFVFIGTPLENEAMKIVKNQIALDVNSKTPSLLAKWMPSENTSSAKTRELAKIVRKHMNLNSKQYRKLLSFLRARINVLERLMSAGKWDEIEFDKIPSEAGLKYKNAFARHDIERIKAGAKSYADFVADENTTVNAGVLYPYEVVSNAIALIHYNYSAYEYELPDMLDTERLAVNKYWDNLTDYFNGKTFNGLAVVDTSGSMNGYSLGRNAAAPINVAISLGMYCAERAKGPFANHYISFASRPQLIEVDGVDFCDKVKRIYETRLIDNTNIEATFDLLLNTALTNHCSQEDLPENIIVLSDMEFDTMRDDPGDTGTLMEKIRKKWTNYGYRMPKIIYWNLDARQDNIPEAIEVGDISFVSGMSPAIFDAILSGKNGYDLMMEKLNSPRYEAIH